MTKFDLAKASDVKNCLAVEVKCIGKRERESCVLHKNLACGGF